MNTSNIKTYAPKARADFMAAVAKRLNQFGIYAGKAGEVTISEPQISGSVMQIDGNSFDATLSASRNNLAKKAKQQGFNQFVEHTAYTWFNRFCAIRYMELHDYLEHGLRVLSHPDKDSGFEILDHAQDVAEDLGLKRDHIVELKLAGNQDEKLYRELLIAQCHKLHQAMPFLFEVLDDATELLLPDNLTRTDSLLRGLVNDIPVEDWEQVEIIGWLYQFYISEKKDEVIGKVVKSEDIPAATQLFTPNWIVKYMVQNSLGAQWLATYPDSPLKAQMDYYIEPAEQTDEVNAKLKAITPETLNPEELTLIDPASGSGHILVEAYDLFKAIYLERGYRQRDIAQLILEKNLFGLDIDERAAQLTGFALMMKGRADDRRLFERGVKLNVMALVDSEGFDADALTQGMELSDYGLQPGNLSSLKDLFEHATTFGSLIQVSDELAKKLPALKELSEISSRDMFVSDALKQLMPLVQQVELLAAQYDAVVANPPYMGGKGMNALVKNFSSDNFPDAKSDLFACFIERAIELTRQQGRIGIVAPYVWMFISSYERFRTKLIDDSSLTSLIQLEYNAFEPACIPVATFTLMRCHVPSFLGSYIKLSEFKGHQNQAPRTLEAIENPCCSWFFMSRPDEFKRIPGSPFAYWLPTPVFSAFGERPPLGKVARAAKGLVTADNNSFVRERWEVSTETIGLGFASREEAKTSEKKWFPYAKGGKFRKWAGNLEAVVNWAQDGEAIQTTLTADGNRVRATNFNLDRIFVEGTSWTVVTSGASSFRFVPQGHLFDAAAGVIQKKPGSLCSSWALLAYLNTSLVRILLDAINPTLNLHPGYIESLPSIDSENRVRAEEIGKAAVTISKRDWDAYERSWDFQSLPILTASTEPSPTFKSSYNIWITQNRDTIAEMKRLEEENNRLFIDAYGLADELTPDVPIEQITLTVNPAYRYGGKLTEDELWTRFREDSMQELVSYAIGCMMGRYSLDEPGLIYAHSGNEGFDPSSYSSFPADDDGIIPLTDIEWFVDDACHRVVEFISVAWDKQHLDENLMFLASNLSPKKNESSRDTIRRYLCTKFFKDHLKAYKKRPIYWLFSSGKQKAFECLVYLHRYNAGTLARMRTEYVTPLLGKYDATADTLSQQIEQASSTAESNRLAKSLTALEKKQAELREFDDKLKHHADMQITLDLDDGVKVNYGKFGDLLVDVKGVTGKK